MHDALSVMHHALLTMHDALSVMHDITDNVSNVMMHDITVIAVMTAMTVIVIAVITHDCVMTAMSLHSPPVM